MLDKLQYIVDTHYIQIQISNNIIRLLTFRSVYSYKEAEHSTGHHSSLPSLDTRSSCLIRITTPPHPKLTPLYPITSPKYYWGTWNS